MPLLWLILAILFLPLLIALFFFQIAAFSFTKLGLSPMGAVLLLGLSLWGSIVNIPISRKRLLLDEDNPSPVNSYIFYYPPRVKEQVIAVNLGGAVIPVLFSLSLLNKVPIGSALLATAIVTIVAKTLAKPVPGVGIKLPAFIPPIVAAIAALILAGDAAAPVAYIAGVWGTLIGADLLNIPQFNRIGSAVISIGGAGVFDGIFLVGLMAALLA